LGWDLKGLGVRKVGGTGQVIETWVTCGAFWEAGQQLWGEQQRCGHGRKFGLNVSFLKGFGGELFTTLIWGSTTFGPGCSFKKRGILNLVLGRHSNQI